MKEPALTEEKVMAGSHCCFHLGSQSKSSGKWHQNQLGPNLRLLMETAGLFDDGVAVSIVLEAETMVGSHYLLGQKLQDCLDDICLEVSASWESSC